MNRKVEKGIATRQHIIAAATRQFAELGYEQTSIETLLGELSISRGALYHHFASKEQLFEAVLEEIEADVAQRTLSARAALAIRPSGCAPAARPFSSSGRTRWCARSC
jgi:AcrR family transcriptional regulator